MSLLECWNLGADRIETKPASLALFPSAGGESEKKALVPRGWAVLFGSFESFADQSRGLDISFRPAVCAHDDGEYRSFVPGDAGDQIIGVRE